MTNSNRAKLNVATGPTEEITPATEAKFVSDKGTPFSIRVRDSGLFYIKMNAGGKIPPMCEEHFTTPRLAEVALSTYLKANDRAGYAEYPDKDK